MTTYDHESCAKVHSLKPTPPHGEPTLFQVGDADLNGYDGPHSTAKAGSRIGIPRSLAERLQTQGLGRIVNEQAE